MCHFVSDSQALMDAVVCGHKSYNGIRDEPGTPRDDQKMFVIQSETMVALDLSPGLMSAPVLAVLREGTIKK